MREFKFRYKIQGDNKLLYDTSPEFCRITQHGVIATSDGGLVFAEKRMQYTGLKDSKGVEIYEGDILRFQQPMSMCVSSSDMEGVVGVVEWNDEEAGFLIVVGGAIYSFAYAFKVEVIGNKFENPELIHA